MILSAASLFFANALFQKRELLKDRNATLVDGFINVARTIEAKDAEDVTAPEIAKDVSEVSDREIANPEKQNLLEDYPMKLETANLPTLNLNSQDKRDQLAALYALDGEGKPRLDADGNKVKIGPGTMAELIGQVLERAKNQQIVLNKTRGELAKMRERVSDNVEEMNKIKVAQRADKRDITAKKEQIETLTSEKEALDAKVVQLTREKKELNAELADQKDQVEKLNEEKVALQEQLENSQKALAEMKEKFKGLGQQRASGTMVAQEGAVASISAGLKGSVISANDSLKFCIVELSPECMTEMLGEERDRPLPQLDMNVRRTGRNSASGEFVTRIKLRQAVPGKNLVIADILNDWQQVPVEKGDVVFF
ncbi:MAG: hypothetical protein J5727_06665 [Kiritimatiellae bacterium]|nr:hypothetical protein [Kiritimatiellia bacterium]